MNGSGETKTGNIQPFLPLAIGGCGGMAAVCLSALSVERSQGILFLLAFEIFLLSLVPILDRRSGLILFGTFNAMLAALLCLRYLGWL